MSVDVRRAATRRGRVGSGLLGRVLLALRVWDERRRMVELDAATLRDMGLTREQILLEARRSFWDLPTGRK